MPIEPGTRFITKLYAGQGPAGSGAPAAWRSGNGVPSDSLGLNGDYYLRTTTGDVYFKALQVYSIIANIKGATGQQGPIGPQGPIGVQGPPGEQGPEGPEGQPGPSGANGLTGAQGPAGAAGSRWRSGSGAPANTLGANGDYYLDSNNGLVYEKVGGVYGNVAIIRGPSGGQGPQGLTGDQGDPGPPGNVGPQGPIGVQGPPGEQGPEGPEGQPGSPGVSTWAGISGKPTTFPPSEHTHSQYGDKSAVNTWTEEQTLDKAFAKRLRLEIVSRTTPGDWPIGVSVVIANLPNVSTTIDCSTLGINSQGPCIDAGCQWSDALCDGTNQTTCTAVDGCSWEINYCADITTSTSCNNSQNCSWDEENEVCTGGIENETCVGTPTDFGCYGSIEDLTGMGFELSTNFADKQFGVIRNITENTIFLLMESELAITVPTNSSAQFVRLGNGIVRID